MTAPIVVERVVAAPAERVYGHLTDAVLWARWQGTAATIDARPGGIFRLAMPNGMTARGQFVTLEPNRRVVFTWGWIDHPGMPPGSTTVEVDLTPEGDKTRIRLTHHGVAADEMEIHRLGWEHYVPRLAMVAAGDDPGPDPGPGG